MMDQRMPAVGGGWVDGWNSMWLDDAPGMCFGMHTLAPNAEVLDSDPTITSRDQEKTERDVVGCFKARRRARQTRSIAAARQCGDLGYPCPRVRGFRLPAREPSTCDCHRHTTSALTNGN